MTEDFYDLLDVPPDASQDEIKEAYREQVRVYHPDHNDDERARAQFTAIRKAYDILGDPVERQAYDRLGHEEYVAKRTSGLPSPDVWRSSEDDADESEGDDGDDSGTTFTYSSEDESSASASTSASGSKSKTKSKTKSAAGATAGATATGSSNATAGGATGTSTGSGTGSTSSSGTNDATGSAGSATSRGTGRSRSSGGRFSDNAAVRWWRRQNFSLPLIWLSVVVYLTGLGHFAVANAAGLEAVTTELSAVGADPAALWEVLTSGRYGMESTFEYVVALEFVAPPLERPLWYAALTGVVGLTLVGLLGARALGDRDLRKPISIDETIVLSLALTATTGLVGGPLLAGTVLMPVLFLVIVRQTRRGPGWKPSYLYVVPVLAPAAGLAFAATTPNEPTVLLDLVSFAILPIVGAFGLPLRATIRKRFGR